MNSFKSHYGIIVFLLFWSSIFYAQNTIIPSDENQKLEKEKIIKIELSRIRDSLKIVFLNEELNNINRPKQEEYENLSKQLIALKQEDSIRISKYRREVNQLKENSKGTPVVFFEDTLFHVYVPLGPYDTGRRAKFIEDKIQELYKTAIFYPDSLTLQESNELLNVNYRKEVITSISLLDALWEEKDITTLGNEYKIILKEEILKYRKQNSLKNNLIRIGEVFLILFLIVISIILINKLFRFIKIKFTENEKRFAQGVKLKNQQILRRSHIVYFINKLLDILYYTIILFIIFIAIPYIFSLFPMMHNWSEVFSKWLWQPIRGIGVGIINYLPHLIKIIIILIIWRYTLRLFRFFALQIERKAIEIKNFYPEWARPTYVVVRFLFSALVLVIIFPYLPGSDSDAFKGVSVLLGVLFSIGSSSAVANVVAGLVITYMRPYKNGDWIKTGNVIGIVMQKEGLVTRLKTINNEEVSVPNSSILSGPTVNYSALARTKGLIITSKIKVRYDYSNDLIEELLIKAAQQTIHISKNKIPYVFQLSLSELNAEYELNAYTFEAQHMYHIKSDLVKNIRNVFTEAGVEIMSTQYITIKETVKPED